MLDYAEGSRPASVSFRKTRIVTIDPLRSPSLAIIERQLTLAPVIRALLMQELNQVRIGAPSTTSALQSAGCRRNILWSRSSAAQGELQTTAVYPLRDKQKRQD